MKYIQRYCDEDNSALTQLINGIRNKDETCMIKLYDDYAAALYGSIRKIVFNIEQAEEVLIKVFTKVLVEIENFKDKSKTFFIWLYNIARNEAIEVLLKNSYQHLTLHTSNTTASLITKKAVLTPVETTILTLVCCRQLSCLQISVLLHLPLPFVKKNLQSAYLNLIPKSAEALSKSEGDGKYMNIIKPVSGPIVQQYTPFLKLFVSTLNNKS